MHRVKALAGKIATKIGASVEKAERAAMLSKTDLRTLMVGEFPELQGIMGEYYAKNDKEDPEVALAIREHYAPRFAGDALPSTAVSTAVALADKMETLCGMFGIGQMPTGDKDPFALRRHALGVLRMIIEGKLNIGLDELISLGFAVESEVSLVKDAQEPLLTFFFERLRVMMREAGFTAQEVEAVLAKRVMKPADFVKRIEAVKKFTMLPEATSLSDANKRICNILRKVTGEIPSEVREDLLKEPAEKELYKALCEHEPVAKLLYESGGYEGMLASLTPLKAPVDTFFSDVMVNAEDPAIRANRQALLKRLGDLMNSVAELSHLAS